MSVSAYLAGKIAGENENSPRMLKLENYIHRSHAMENSTIALPYLMLFGLDSDYACMSATTQSLLLSLDSKLPWLRVVMYPILHLAAAGKIHRLESGKYPARLGSIGHCPKWTPHPFRGLGLGNARFWNWMEAHMSPDGTLFDYAPTSVPALMALSTGGTQYAGLLNKGIQTLEGFLIQTPQGSYESPGEASIGETNMVLIALLELGHGPDEPIIRDAEKFLYSVQQTETGGFGMSKHNIHFPDADDTAYAVYALHRIAQLRGHSANRLDRAVDWLLSVQNKDGGFGTWERSHTEIFDRLANKTGIVLSESVPEHTARAVMMLANVKNGNERYRKAYDRAMKFLLSRQRPDGSFAGTWFVDYLMGTSFAVAAFGTQMDNPQARAAAERGIAFILAHQAPDGGFSESPSSFDQARTVALEKSSPAQTGMVLTQLLTFLREENWQHRTELATPLERGVEFLVRTQAADGVWHDRTWTGVTFPKVEYLIYPYVQDAQALQAIGMYKMALESGGLSRGSDIDGP